MQLQGNAVVQAAKDGRQRTHVIDGQADQPAVVLTVPEPAILLEQECEAVEAGPLTARSRKNRLAVSVP